MGRGRLLPNNGHNFDIVPTMGAGAVFLLDFSDQSGNVDNRAPYRGVLPACDKSDLCALSADFPGLHSSTTNKLRGRIYYGEAEHIQYVFVHARP